MSRIPQEFIDDLLNRLDIVEVIDSRVKLKKTGKNYSACCPFHKEKTPSFSVSPDKQFYYCFGCGASGSAIGFLMEYEHLSFVDAIENLAASQGLAVPREQTDKKSRKPQTTLYTLLEKVKAYYQTQLSEHPKRQEATTYLKNRGLSGTIAKQFALGFAPPGWDNLLIKFGLSDDDRKRLETAGLTIHIPDSGKTYDRFRHRIMFPIINTRGRTIGFGGRILASNSEPQKADGKNKAGGPKYLNSPETPVFFKGKELYGLYQALQANRKLEHVIVVEGYMDVIALAQFGITNAVATLGTACGEDHLRLAFRYTSNIVFCFDGDNAGRKAARRALENALPAMSDGKKITFLFLPEGQDPDSLVRQIGQQRFTEQVESALPLETFFFEAVAEGIDTRTMDGRARMSKLAAPLLNKLPQGVYRELMFDSLAKRTGLSLDVLQDLISIPTESAEPTQPESLTQAPETASEVPRQAPQPVSAPPPWPDTPPNQVAPPIRNNRRTLISPARLATTLLLESPELIKLPFEFELPDSEDPDVTQLRRLLGFLKERPQTSFHSILGYWAGQYGLDEQNNLTQLVANQFLGSAKKTSTYNSEQELVDAFKRLQQEEIIRKCNSELAELSKLRSLSDEQKQRLKELLLRKSQSGQKHSATSQ